MRGTRIAGGGPGAWRLRCASALRRGTSALERRVLRPLLYAAFRARSPSLGQDARIVFVCEGNVCRSPFAARYAESRFEAGSVESHGMSLDAGRRAPEAAVEVGRCFGVELGDHRSRILDAETVRSCDVVFAMDSANLLSLYRTFPDSMHKVFLLDAAREIPDPYGGDLERFASVYAQIAAAIDSLCRAG